jgi:predicted dehydrogenase
MSKIIRWGILAPGQIARKFASDLKLVSDAKLVAVGSRDIIRSKKFAMEFGADLAFDSYEELVKSQEIDVIYVASPHTCHFEHTMLCLENGKNVLCEKPMAMNSHELETMVQKAKEKNLFLMEAFWTRFIPSYQKFRELALSGEIGMLHYLQADFGFHLPYNPEHRLWNKSLGGGSLLDIGIYPIFMALDVAGMPNEILSDCNFSQDGIDESCSVVFKYCDDKILANLSSTILANTPVEAIACGERGYIKLNRMWHTPTSIELVKEEEKTTLTFEEKGFGYEYEIEEVNTCLNSGKKESDIFPLLFSRQLHKTLDTIRQQIGLKYPADEK